MCTFRRFTPVGTALSGPLEMTSPKKAAVGLQHDRSGCVCRCNTICISDTQGRPCSPPQRAPELLATPRWSSPASPPLSPQQAPSVQLLQRLSLQLPTPRASQSYYLQQASPPTALHHQGSSTFSPPPTLKPPLTSPLYLRGYLNEI